MVCPLWEAALFLSWYMYTDTVPRIRHLCQTLSCPRSLCLPRRQLFSTILKNPLETRTGPIEASHILRIPAPESSIHSNRRPHRAVITGSAYSARLGIRKLAGVHQ